MNQLDRQDAKRYWRIAQARSSAQVFAEGAETGFRQRFGELAKGVAREAFGAVGSIFHMTGGLLDVLEKGLDKARFARSHSRSARRKAFRERATAYEVLRDVVCRARQFADSVTGGKGNVYLGVRGPTPRNAEKLAAWGRIIVTGLREADLPLAARAMAAAFAGEIEQLSRELEVAIEQADEAWADERLDNAELKHVRENVDAELAKIVAFLRTNLELAGHDYLASRVLGKRRGRPRKSRKKTDTAPQPAIETAREIESVPQPATGAGRKFDSAPAQEAPEAFVEPRKTEQASSEARKVPRKIAERPDEASEAPEKIAKVLCKPCTEPSREGEVVSFQEDTPRSGRRRRRRVAEALLGASKRWLTSGWMGGFVSGERRRREGSGRG